MSASSCRICRGNLLQRLLALEMHPHGHRFLGREPCAESEPTLEKVYHTLSRCGTMLGR
jgi:hypothetical protein